jgi:N-acetylglutamate synthase-like GNAT family acetyltransferase
MDNLIIRECTYGDIDHIIDLQRQWQMEEITYGFVPADKSYLEEKLGKYFYIAELNTEIIGFAYGTVHMAENMSIFNDGQYYIEVDDIYVSQNNRDSGLGSLLLYKLLDVAKENGIERSLIYSSTKDMDSIINFYKRHDYKTWYIQMYK